MNVRSIQLRTGVIVSLLMGLALQASAGVTAGESGRSDLVIAAQGRSDAIVVVSPEAKRERNHPRQYERMAAEDLVKYIELMTGAEPALADTAETVAAALKEKRKPVLIVGGEAAGADKKLGARLKKTAKQDPQLRADAIVVQRDGNRVYLLGLTDDGHYHAVAELLHRWGCRWYLPTDFGECIPQHDALSVGKLDYAYASPFEVRSYWISWNGSQGGRTEFQLRNRMAIGVPPVSTGHALGPLTEEIIPEGKTIFTLPLAEEKTAQHVAGKIIAQLDKSTTGTASLSVSDGIYKSDSERDKELQAGLFDKYFMTPGMTDVFMTLYNRVCDIIREKRPDLAPRLGFLAYSNMTIPPQRVLKADPFLYCDLAPIDIDPNHGMDHPWSPPRQEYRETLYRWSEVMDGRVMIYDYDQGMLVWRDVPNPSHMAFRQDVKHYAKAGILGVRTECRNAIATVFLNLHIRGQLMWDPDTDVDALLEAFYPAFYGPAAEPMAKYWTALYQAWEDTIVTEHEFFTIPAIYTPELLAELGRHLEAGERIIAELDARSGERTRNDELYSERMTFTRVVFDVLDAYTRMVRSGATECRYKDAHESGVKGWAKVRELAAMNPTFTTRVIGPAKLPDYGGSPAWWPGEVKLYEDFKKLTDGTDGKLIQVLPLEWPFRRDPNDTGVAMGWAYQPSVDLSYWDEHKDALTVRNRKDFPTTEWEVLRSDLYMQAQGILHPDRQSYTGYAWYRTGVELGRGDVEGDAHVMFPGLIGEAWLYVNGELVAHRQQRSMWWYNDYSFKWDVPLAGRLQKGGNLVVLRCKVEHHMGGMFRRPFLYTPKK